MRQSLKRAAGTVAGLLLIAAVGGCSDEPDTSSRQHNDSAAQHQQPAGGGSAQAQQADAPSGLLKVDGRQFEVTLATCMALTDDIVLSGPATESDGSASGYFDGDIVDAGEEPYGELRIDLGATGPYESSDEFIAFGNTLGGELTVTDTGAGHVITASSWAEDGTDLGTAVFEFTCA